MKKQPTIRIKNGHLVSTSTRGRPKIRMERHQEQKFLATSGTFREWYTLAMEGLTTLFDTSWYMYALSSQPLLGKTYLCYRMQHYSSPGEQLFEPFRFETLEDLIAKLDIDADLEVGAFVMRMAPDQPTTPPEQTTEQQSMLPLEV